MQTENLAQFWSIKVPIAVLLCTALIPVATLLIRSDPDDIRNLKNKMKQIKQVWGEKTLTEQDDFPDDGLNAEDNAAKAEALCVGPP